MTMLMTADVTMSQTPVGDLLSSPHTRSNTQPYKSMDSISSEPRMQIDEPDHHDANSSMIPSFIGTPTSRQRFFISDENFKDTCELLGCIVHRFYRDDDDTETQDIVPCTVWSIVQKALSNDLEVIERIADVDEFKANVEHEGVKRFRELLRDTAKRGSWLDLIENSTRSASLF